MDVKPYPHQEFAFRTLKSNAAMTPSKRIIPTELAESYFRAQCNRLGRPTPTRDSQLWFRGLIHQAENTTPDEKPRAKRKRASKKTA